MRREGNRRVLGNVVRRGKGGVELPQVTQNRLQTTGIRIQDHVVQVEEGSSPGKRQRGAGRRFVCALTIPA